MQFAANFEEQEGALLQYPVARGNLCIVQGFPGLSATALDVRLTGMYGE